MCQAERALNVPLWLFYSYLWWGMFPEGTLAGFEPICCSFAYDEIHALLGCKLAITLFTLAEGCLYFLRCKEFNYWRWGGLRVCV